MEKEVNIVQLFDAPRELVFKAWTDPELLPKWFAPDNCTIHFKTLDIRPGGSFHSCIFNPEYGDCWAIGKYIEIINPEKIAYTIAIADENGNLAQATEVGKQPDWPSETLVTVTFTEVDSITQVVLHQTVPESTAKQTGAYPSWLQMLDRLAQLIS